MRANGRRRFSNDVSLLCSIVNCTRDCGAYGNCTFHTSPGDNRMSCDCDETHKGDYCELLNCITDIQHCDKRRGEIDVLVRREPATYTLRLGLNCDDVTTIWYVHCLQVVARVSTRHGVTTANAHQLVTICGIPLTAMTAK